MKNLRKRIVSCAMLIIMMATVSITAFAVSQSGSSLGHTNDKWEYGAKFSLLKNSHSQYSEFYCKDKSHAATARVKTGSKLVLHEDKISAKAGKWAKAATGYYKEVKEWNSYYSHQ